MIGLANARARLRVLVAELKRLLAELAAQMQPPVGLIQTISDIIRWLSEFGAGLGL